MLILKKFHVGTAALPVWDRVSDPVLERSSTASPHSRHLSRV